MCSTSPWKSNRVGSFSHRRQHPLLTNLVDLLASYEVSAQIAAIEDLIAQGADMQVVVRLLCLASITAGGIKAKTLENIKRELLQVCPVVARCNVNPVN